MGERHDTRTLETTIVNSEDFSLSPQRRTILYASDFSRDSESAFVHALKLALAGKRDLTLVHASEDREEWDKFPGVREMLERWGVLPQNSARSAVGELGIEVKKVMVHASKAVNAVLKYEEKHDAEIIVMASFPHEGISNWFRESVGEPVARESGAKTLFVPGGKQGIVAGADGSVHLGKILIPVTSIPDPQSALTEAARLVQQLGAAAGTFTLLHVGPAEEAPRLRCPEVPGWEWTEVAKEGDVVETILGVAQSLGADLIVMAADGRDGLWDSVRGSHSERVLRASFCPLLICPVKPERIRI